MGEILYQSVKIFLLYVQEVDTDFSKVVICLVLRVVKELKELFAGINRLSIKRIEKCLNY